MHEAFSTRSVESNEEARNAPAYEQACLPFSTRSVESNEEAFDFSRRVVDAGAFSTRSVESNEEAHDNGRIHPCYSAFQYSFCRVE